MIITEPKSVEDFEKYYQLRWEVLRKPWNKPRGSERDEMEESCIHAMATNDLGEVLAVCRLQFNSAEEAQIRYMAVKENTQGMGIGGAIISYIEKTAINKGKKIIVLHARENATGFYKKNGYNIMKTTYILWGEIQHYLMKKNL